MTALIPTAIQNMVDSERLIDIVTAFKTATGLKLMLVLQDKPDMAKVQTLTNTISALPGSSKMQLYVALKKKVTVPDSNPFDVLTLRGSSTSVTIEAKESQTNVTFDNKDKVMCSGGEVRYANKTIIDRNEALFSRIVATAAHVVNGNVQPFHTASTLKAQPDPSVRLMTAPSNTNATLSHGEYKNVALKHFRSLTDQEKRVHMSLVPTMVSPLFADNPPIELGEDAKGEFDGKVKYYVNAHATSYSVDQKTLHELTSKFATSMDEEGVRALSLDTYLGAPLGRHKDIEHLINVKAFHAKDTITIIDSKDPLVVRFLQENLGNVFGITDSETDSLFMNTDDIKNNPLVEYIYHATPRPAISKAFKDSEIELRKEWKQIHTIESKYGEGKKHVWMLPLSTITSYPRCDRIAFDNIIPGDNVPKTVRDYLQDPKDLVRGKQFESRDVKELSRGLDGHGLHRSVGNVLNNATMTRGYIRAVITPTSVTNCSILWCQDFDSTPLLNIVDSLFDYHVHTFYGIFFPTAFTDTSLTFKFLTNLVDVGAEVHMSSTIARKAIETMMASSDYKGESGMKLPSAGRTRGVRQEAGGIRDDDKLPRKPAKKGKERNDVSSQWKPKDASPPTTVPTANVPPPPKSRVVIPPTVPPTREAVNEFATFADDGQSVEGTGELI